MCVFCVSAGRRGQRAVSVELCDPGNRGGTWQANSRPDLVMLLLLCAVGWPRLFPSIISFDFFLRLFSSNISSPAMLIIFNPHTLKPSKGYVAHATGRWAMFRPDLYILFMSAASGRRVFRVNSSCPEVACFAFDKTHEDRFETRSIAVVALFFCFC